MHFVYTQQLRVLHQTWLLSSRGLILPVQRRHDYGQTLVSLLQQPQDYGRTRLWTWAVSKVMRSGLLHARMRRAFLFSARISRGHQLSWS